MSKAGRNSPSKDSPATEVPARDFESAMAELESIVAGMESGDQSLEASLRAYQRGMELAAYCRKTLSEAEQQVKILEDGVFKDFSLGDDTEDDTSR